MQRMIVMHNVIDMCPLHTPVFQRVVQPRSGAARIVAIDRLRSASENLPLMCGGRRVRTDRHRQAGCEVAARREASAHVRLSEAGRGRSLSLIQ